MASPLLGIAAVNSLLFTAYGVTRRIISPYPDLTMGQIAMAGAGAGAINAVLASPVSLDIKGFAVFMMPECHANVPHVGRAIQDQDARAG
jgi:hypothetical protein